MNIFFWRKKSKWKTYTLIALLALFVCSILIFHIQTPFTFERLRESYHEIIKYYDQSPVLFTLSLFAIYVLSVCLIIPDSTIISLFTGTLYPLPFATLFISFSETIGATIFFFVIRYVLKEYFARKEKKILNGNIGKKFKEHEINYLLFLRMSHFLPFWLINVLSALLNTRTITFIWTTFIGTLPLSYILSQAGRGLKLALESDKHVSFFQILNKPTEMLLVGIGALMLLPILIKKIFKIFR